MTERMHVRYSPAVSAHRTQTAQTAVTKWHERIVLQLSCGLRLQWATTKCLLGTQQQEWCVGVCLCRSLTPKDDVLCVSYTVYSLSVVGNNVFFWYVDAEHIVSCDWLHMYAFTLKEFHVVIRREWRHEHVSTRAEAFLWYCNV